MERIVKIGDETYRVIIDEEGYRKHLLAGLAKERRERLDREYEERIRRVPGLLTAAYWLR